MCGIAGIVSFTGAPVQHCVLNSMVSALAHRGPDDSGVRILPESGKSRDERDSAGITVGLAHARLSIIDLSVKGRQPLCNENREVWISFNGEIYNHLELRQELEARGHVFGSRTDTEAIVHAFEEFGEDVFARLDGMFALALWDAGSRSLYLARDRYGQKPLYYRQESGGIVFASELKALCRYPAFKRELDLEGLSQYLAYEYLPVPRTIYRGVRKLEPGTFMRCGKDGMRVTRYWQISFAPDRTLHAGDASAQLTGTLREAVRRRLMSDVPLGVFLSGGIDSSSLVALMSEFMDPRKINTYAIGFREHSFDESGYAAAVSRHFGTTHHERLFTPAQMLELLPEIWEFMDEPLADPSLLPTYMLCRFARETITVALGGDAGDELLAGYDPFLAHRLARACDSLPRLSRSTVFTKLAAFLPVSSANMGFSFRLRQFLKGLPYPLRVRNQVWLGSFSPEEQRCLLAPDVLAALGDFDPYAIMDESARDMRFRDWLDEMVFIYSRFYLGEDILTKIDRASMAVSLEVRSPFLDAEFAGFANSLPGEFKLRRLSRKYILKRAMRGRLPDFVLRRPKKGFGLPLTGWLKAQLRPLVEDALSRDSIERRGLFNPLEVRRIVEAHYAGKRDFRKQIWTLLVFEMWCRHYLDTER